MVHGSSVSNAVLTMSGYWDMITANSMQSGSFSNDTSLSVTIGVSDFRSILDHNRHGLNIVIKTRL
jgi:hypothetical protein